MKQIRRESFIQSNFYRFFTIFLAICEWHVKKNSSFNENQTHFSTSSSDLNCLSALRSFLERESMICCRFTRFEKLIIEHFLCIPPKTEHSLLSEAIGFAVNVDGWPGSTYYYLRLGFSKNNHFSSTVTNTVSHSIHLEPISPNSCLPNFEMCFFEICVQPK